MEKNKTMATNHDLKANEVINTFLQKVRAMETGFIIKGINPSKLHKVGCGSKFPVSDSNLSDGKKLIAIEFKPSTESNRGVITGVGQAAAYLAFSNMSFLFIPERLDDGFECGEYMIDYYNRIVIGKNPIGLVIYDNNNPSNIRMAHNITTLSINGNFAKFMADREYAKHQDLPHQQVHLVLHYYYLKAIAQKSGDAFENYYIERHAKKSMIDNLKCEILKDMRGENIVTMMGNSFTTPLEKRINKVSMLEGVEKQKAWDKLYRDIDPKTKGRSNYQSIRKSTLSFFKHIGLIDSSGDITELGIRLYNYGMLNGPKSQVFIDNYARTVLINGKHLELILNMNDISCDGVITNAKVISQIEIDNDKKGLIKHNAGRGKKGTKKYLTHELQLWKSLNLIMSDGRINIRRIIMLCSMPD